MPLFKSSRSPPLPISAPVFTEPLSASEATRRAGANITYERRPAFVYGANGEPIAVPDTYGIGREGLTERPGEELTEAQKNESVLGTCSKTFELIGNMELAAMLDPLTERYPVESVGVLGDGERIFYCLRAPESSDVNGDEIRNYFTVLGTKTPGHRARIFYSPVRVVCYNTLIRGIREASINFEVRHTKGARDEMQFYSALVTQMAREQEETLWTFRRMAATPIAPEATRSFVEGVFALPKEPARSKELDRHDFDRLIAQGVAGAQAKYDNAKSAREAWEKSCERVKEYRKTALELIARNNDLDSRHAGTVWAVYNGCTEVSDWRPGRNAAESTLFGARAEEKALAYEVAMIFTK